MPSDMHLYPMMDFHILAENSESQTQSHGEDTMRKGPRTVSSRSNSDSDATSPIPVSDDSSLSVTFGDFHSRETIPTQQTTPPLDKPEKGNKDITPCKSESVSSTTKDRKSLQEGDVGGAINPRELQFFSGNPSVEVTKGILHLFKEK